jgi:hypothetical protein
MSSTSSLRARLTARKGVLFGCASMICYLYPSSLLQRIVVQVYIGRLVEAVVRGFGRGWADEVVNVGKAVQTVRKYATIKFASRHLQCKKRHLALLWRHDYGRV